MSAGFRNAFVAKGYGRLFRTMRSGRSYLGYCEVAISPQGDLVADGWGGVWEIATGQSVEKLRWESGTGIGVDFSPDQGLLAISNDDGRVSVWKTTDWTQKRELTLGPEVEGIKSVYEIEFSRDGKSLAAAYWDWDQDRQLWVWDTHTWERTNRLTDIGIFPLGLAFFPDSGRVAVASRQDIKTWDRGTGGPGPPHGSTTSEPTSVA